MVEVVVEGSVYIALGGGRDMVDLAGGVGLQRVGLDLELVEGGAVGGGVVVGQRVDDEAGFLPDGLGGGVGRAGGGDAPARGACKDEVLAGGGDFAGDVAGLLSEADVAGEFAGGLVLDRSGCWCTPRGEAGDVRSESGDARELCDAVLAGSEVKIFCSDGDCAGYELTGVGDDFARGAIDMGVAGELDAWLVYIPTRAAGLQIVNGDFAVGNVEFGVGRANVGSDFAGAVDLPTRSCEPGFRASQPASDAAGRMHGDWPGGVIIRKCDSAGQAGVELVALAVDLELRGIDLCGLTGDGIEHAGGSGADFELRLGPNGSVAQSNTELGQITFHCGRELVGFSLLPSEFGVAGAGKLNVAEVDELAKLVGKAVEVELGFGG